MRRPLAIMAAVALAAAAVASPVSAGKQLALDLSAATGGSQWDRVIEKQNPWPQPDPSLLVVNPDPAYTWDINDYSSVATSGYLASGASVGTTWRHIFDWSPMYRCISGSCGLYSMPTNAAGTWVQAPSPDLIVSLCFTPQGRCFAVAPVWNGSTYDYQTCIKIVYGDGDPAIIDIAGSNGGRGVPTDISLTVVNPHVGKTGTIKDVAVGWGISSDVSNAPGCHNSFSHDDYPFRWYP